MSTAYAVTVQLSENQKRQLASVACASGVRHRLALYASR